ncbi:MAG: hypothetical protein FJ254_06120 [Phycisphaerae bacterium]|nr:hypothetical protein [Phycisphaerae bacterium]
MTPVRWAWSTPMQPGAIALVTLVGEPSDLDALLSACCRRVPAVGATARCMFDDSLGTIDDGVAVRASPTSALLMPHGGVRIAQRVQAWLRAHGAIEGQLADLALFPECTSSHAAAAARMMGRCASRRALELLRDHADRIERFGPTTAHDVARARRLRVLIDPPTVVIAGPSNVGKSTLTNAIARRTVSVTDDSAGTTRDPVPVRLDLDGVTVDWIDLPGLLDAPSDIDASAASIAARLAASASVIVLATAPGHGWPMLALPGHPTIVRVLLQDDRPDAASCIEREHALVTCSARQSRGLECLALAIRRALISDDDLADPRAWAFDGD